MEEGQQHAQVLPVLGRSHSLLFLLLCRGGTGSTSSLRNACVCAGVCSVAWKFKLCGCLRVDSLSCLCVVRRRLADEREALVLRIIVGVCVENAAHSVGFDVRSAVAFEVRERIFVDVVGDEAREEGKGAVETDDVLALEEHKTAADTLEAGGTAQVVVRANAVERGGRVVRVR